MNLPCLGSESCQGADGDVKNHSGDAEFVVDSPNGRGADKANKWRRDQFVERISRRKFSTNALPQALHGELGNLSAGLPTQTVFLVVLSKPLQGRDEGIWVVTKFLVTSHFSNEWAP